MKAANAAMGFEQAKTTHHFLLKPDGGAIQVQADDPQDTVSLGQIRKHFQRIAAAFAAGDFQIPMIVHDTLPPGANAMKRLHEKIHYTYEEMPTGARVVIKTDDSSALDAIHDFLRYQIREHETSDRETCRRGENVIRHDQEIDLEWNSYKAGRDSTLEWALEYREGKSWRSLLQRPYASHRRRHSQAPAFSHKK